MFGSTNLLPHVAQCGYIPFYQDIESDHRGMFLDLHGALHDRKVALQGPKPREIGSHSNLKQMMLYKQYILNHFQHQNIEERALKLYTISNAVPIASKPRFLRQLNILDQQVTAILLRAEKKFGSDPMKAYTGNHQVAQYQLIVRYWKVYNRTEVKA